MKRENRIFFVTEKEALQNNYRPFGHCMKDQYQKWKNELFEYTVDKTKNWFTQRRDGKFITVNCLPRQKPMLIENLLNNIEWRNDCINHSKLIPPCRFYIDPIAINGQCIRFCFENGGGGTIKLVPPVLNIEPQE